MSQQTNHVATDNVSDLTRTQFLLRTLLAGVRTAHIVLVKKVTLGPVNEDGVPEIGVVDIQPMVSAVDGEGGLWPHGTITNVPYMRIQGGANGVVLDPAIGDIGIAVVCDRDISTVKNSKVVSAPGSTRKHDMSDLVYLMTVISSSGPPTQYVMFNDDGINITSNVRVVVNTDECTVNAQTTTVNSIDTVVNTHTSEVNASVSASITSPDIELGNGGTLRKLVNELFQSLFNNHTHKSNGTGAQTDATLTPISATQLTTVVKAG